MFETIELLTRVPPEPEDPAIFRVVGNVVVDDTLGLDQMVKAGRYHGVNSDITAKNFPIARKDKHAERMAVIAFGRPVTSDEAIALIAARTEGIRPATADELFAFGMAIEKLRENDKLSPPRRIATCLGQSAIINGKRVVPEIWSVDYGDWNAGTESWDSTWSSRRRFLVVFKQ